ncbi:MAG: hypothetical protein WCT04_13350 [Planctomycetota bacterium]
MKIEILSHRELVQRAFQNTPHNLIFITSLQNPFVVERSRDAVDKVANKLVLLFDDLTTQGSNPNAPTMQHTRDAIQFAQGLDDLVVSCHMGMSRSAAIAFAVVVKRVGMAEAFKMLHSQRHSPNSLIVGHIQEVLDLPYLAEAMDSWKNGRQKDFEYYISEHNQKLRRREQLHRK